MNVYIYIYRAYIYSIDRLLWPVNMLENSDNQPPVSLFFVCLVPFAVCQGTDDPMCLALGIQSNTEVVAHLHADKRAFLILEILPFVFTSPNVLAASRIIEETFTQAFTSYHVDSFVAKTCLSHN